MFAKNSDRPPGEVQLVSAHRRRPAGGVLATQYLRLEDQGAVGALLAQPTWLWGAEHGVNEHGVAIGNERIESWRRSPRRAALIGMDLVRLALERAQSASEAVEVIGSLLERHGQGGVCDAEHGDAYCSSFLVADREAAWVVETSGSSWAAGPAAGWAALSNRLVLGRRWRRGSPDLAPGEDVENWWEPSAPTGHADIRLAASRRLLAGRGPRLEARDLVAHLRDHGRGPWGAPAGAGAIHPPPEVVESDFTGVSVCMHVRGYMDTTSSMVAELPASKEAPLRAWVAPGSPCVSVFVPVFPPQERGVAVAGALADEELWRLGATLRQRVEENPEALYELRSFLAPLEAELWEEADAVAERPDRWAGTVEGFGGRVAEALRCLDRSRS